MIGLLRRKAGGVPAALETRRLRLVSLTPELVQAEADGRYALEHRLRAAVHEAWPPEHWEPHVRAHILAQYEAHPETLGWHRYVLLAGRPEQLIGCLGAFPCAVGDVEIGYSVVTPLQRQGYGTEAAQAFVTWLLGQPTIRSVSAQTYATMPHSVKVMERCGMRWIGAGDEAGTVRYRRWR